MLSFTQFVSETPTSGASDNVIQTHEYEIPVHNLEYLTDKINKLNKTATKLNLKPITIETIGAPFTKKRPNPNDPLGIKPPIVYEVIKIKLTGEAPKLEGWTFVGKREPLEGTEGVLTKSAPGMEIPGKYMGNAALKCDHCARGKRRSSTFIVKKDKVHKEVGRMCLKDFLGHDDPSKFADYATSLADLANIVGEFRDPDYGGMGRRELRFETAEVVAVAIHRIKDKGFVPRSTDGRGNVFPTATAVYEHFDPPELPPRANYTAKEWHDMHHIPVTDADRQEAKEATKWIHEHPNAQREEFWRNSSMIVNAPSVNQKLMSYIVAAVNQFLKAKGNEGARQTLKSQLSNEYVAPEGTKIDIKATIIGAFAYETAFGTKRVITVRTEKGALIKMFTMSGDSSMKKDDLVNITGTVGKNELESYDRSPFKGMKISTMAPRARIRHA